MSCVGAPARARESGPGPGTRTVGPPLGLARPRGSGPVADDNYVPGARLVSRFQSLCHELTHTALNSTLSKICTRTTAPAPSAL